MSDILNNPPGGRLSKLLFFLRLDNIMAEHVWEHLTDADTELATGIVLRI